jgi:phosphoribosylformylglycinamidine cyclo-ligase
VFFERAGLNVDTFVPELGSTVADALLAPHRSYLHAVRPLIEAGLVNGMAHVTGGGITENLPRVLPDECGAEIDRSAWTVPPIFRMIQDLGGIAREEMFRAFNMGIGLIVVCARSDVDRVFDVLRHQGEAPVVLGAVSAGSGVKYVEAAIG